VLEIKHERKGKGKDKEGSCRGPLNLKEKFMPDDLRNKLRCIFNMQTPWLICDELVIVL
jgi:hypothetical protein